MTPAQAGRFAQTAPLAEPAEPSKPVEPAELAEPVERAESAEPAKADKVSKSTGYARHDGQAEYAGQAAPAQATLPTDLPERLRAALAEADARTSASALLQDLVRRELDRLPAPGAGATLRRWQALASVAQHDLSLAKLYEGHTDALAILDELGVPEPSPTPVVWAVWAAEAPEGRTTIEPQVHGHAHGQVWLHGAKCWCSGAASASHGLLTAWHADGRGPQLVSLRLSQPGVQVSAAAWQAVGMHGSASLDIRFERAEARLVGGVGDYLARPGFWQGGAGVAACWYGGALALALALHRALQSQAPAVRHAFRLAALGRLDVVLAGTAAVLRESARWIDRHPLADASAIALRARLCAEQAATEVLDVAGRALGAGAFCRDGHFARMAADLPVFIRQSHAERDFAALGERVLDGGQAWAL